MIANESYAALSMTQDSSLVDRMLALLPEAQLKPGMISGVTLVRVDASMPVRRPVIYEPCMYFVIQGSKSALLEGQEFIFDAMNYLVLSVPLPLECRVTSASSEEPYLAVKIEIDLLVLQEIIRESSGDGGACAEGPGNQEKVEQGIFVSSVSENISSALTRLLDVIGKPDQANVLGKLNAREILFYVLQGPQGKQLESFAYKDRNAFRIGCAIDYIQKNYATNIEVEALASLASMSQSSFYAYFKSVTRKSPIQYIKSIRLYAARQKIVYDNSSASDAAFQVGYASPSQFSREYRRMFGVPPSEDKLFNQVKSGRRPAGRGTLGSGRSRASRRA